MEQKAANTATKRINPKTTNDIPLSNDHEHGSFNKKKNGTKNIFKVALYMMRGRSKKSKMLPLDEGNTWKKLVGSMRPLHLQSNQSPQHNPQLLKSGTSPCENANEEVFDSFPTSPYSPSTASSSRYASAVGLNEMVKDEENQEEEESVKDNGDEDEMIDAKAEEFIAQFYQQMRLQRLHVTDRRYEEISLRSLGL